MMTTTVNRDPEPPERLYQTVIHNRVRTDVYGRHYVHSATEEGKFYLIQDGVCTCRGFEYRHHCSHLDLLIFLGLIHKDDVDFYRYEGVDLQSGEISDTIERN